MLPPAAGHLELICGPMFAGKTTALIERLEAARATGRRVVVAKPEGDIRYGAAKIVTHTGRVLVARPIRGGDDVDRVARGADVLGVDEVHFFDPSFADACGASVQSGLVLLAAGVDLDHRGQAFATVAALRCIAHRVSELTSICARCGAEARYTQRLVASNARIVVGGVGAYEPRCEQCFVASPPSGGAQP